MATPAPSPSTTPPAAQSPGSPPARSSAPGTTPAPSPGSLEDPQGEDVSQQDTGSAGRRRSAELAAMKPAAPGSAVGFDVQPQHVYYASYVLRNAQYDFADRARSLVATLDGYPHAAGCGTGPEAFARAYAETAALFLEVWDRATEGVGGAAVGLTVTANHYAEAEHATNVLTPAVVKKSPPAVLKKSGAGGSVAELSWGNGPVDDGWGNAIVDDVSGVVSWAGDHILRPVLKYALQHGKVADITPGGDDVDLPKIAQAWRQACTDAGKSATTFDDAIAYITNAAPGHDEWQSAMKQFCSAIWGTSDWGKEHHGHKWAHKDGRQPALDVLQDTARAVATACDGAGAEVTKVRSAITDVYKDAAMRTFAAKGVMDALEKLGELPGLAAEFISNIDTGRLNHAVDSYNTEMRGYGDDLTRLKGALEEAERSVPTYAAEEARAEAFGARSMNEFRPEHKYIRDGDEENHFYALDLASQEGIHGSHVIDKHVGKTDEQLAQRLRDQQILRDGTVRPVAASSFTNMASAQRFTQETMDDVGNAEKIENWLKRLENNPNERSTLNLSLSFNEVTGRTVLRSEYDQKALGAQGVDAHSVEVVLRYKQAVEPKFVVLTSMPTTP
ncbi:RNase A-like domain-containing protein [Streptomyces sp. NPDC096934]|uniref:RNase A-like domain-containing protein n=1 Tax=Streptomyces sp. NPDC096934 TaxID=3155551 RepID=UPI00332C7B0D